jgi:hypothetical protein
MQPEDLPSTPRAVWCAPGAWRDPRGQTTTEWLMIAGLLAAVGLFLQGLMSRTLWEYSHQLITSLRTIAP